MIDGQKVRRKCVTDWGLPAELSSSVSVAARGVEHMLGILRNPWRLKERVHITGNSILLNCRHIVNYPPWLLFLEWQFIYPLEGNWRGQQPLEIGVIYTRIQWETVMNTFQRLVVKDLLSQIISNMEIQYLTSLHKILSCWQQRSFQYMGYSKC